MHTLIKSFLFINMLFLSLVHSKTIKIVLVNDLEPYYFLDKNKKVKGFLIDYWKLWSKKTNIKIKFIVKTWPKALNAIRTKEADIMLDYCM